jgi:hypothetical protein
VERRFDRRKVRARTDRALCEGIRGLADGEDVGEVIERLHEATHRGDALPDGRPRLYYDMTLDWLRDAAARDRALEWELRARELLEAVREAGIGRGMTVPRWGEGDGVGRHGRLPAYPWQRDGHLRDWAV